VNSIRLAAGIAIRDGNVLLVASSYPSHPMPLWNLPGGRVAAGELLEETVLRETHEETGLRATLGPFAYLSESYDGERHVLAAIFHINVSGTLRPPGTGDHVVTAQWVPQEALAERLSVRVVREPLLGYLTSGRRYFGVHDVGISVRWPDES
jgi:ADP-ribose pyrophosphatase YjhB (NUDIX family)